MPATEETYRSQPTLHIVFALTSIAMTLSIVWMIMADHLRPWKETQREFHKIEVAKLTAVEEQRLQEQQAKSQAKLDALDAKIEAAKESADANRSELRKVDADIKRLGGRFELLDTEKKFQKAELDSLRSLFDGFIDRGDEHEAFVFLRSSIVPAEQKYNRLALEYEKANNANNAAKARREELLGNIDDLTKQREDLTRSYDNARRTVKQKNERYFGFWAWFRNLPFMDLAAPPEKIQQISLPELTINYNFKDVPRYDRCATCHQGIDKPGYDVDAHDKPMPRAFASHPQLTDGATTVDPKGHVVKAGLYLHGNGPHPINSFGCTICHGGQGSGTDFSYSSHTPNDLKQKNDWVDDHHWHEMHDWIEPMLPKRFLESSCLKCHHEVTDVPKAKKVQAGYERIVKYGCTGCHTIGGEGSFGPDLTDEKQVGPNLGHLGSKVSKEWALKWIANPHAFRPDTRMPRFYGVTNNNDKKKDWPKNYAEIQAITHYLFAKSTPPSGFVDPPAKSDPARGKTLFFQKGCLACHSHRPYEASEIQSADQSNANPKYKPEPASTYDPKNFPESVRQYAKANHGPNLSNIADKFQSTAQGQKWLANWIKAPESYHPKSLMPNLQLSEQDAADIAAWIISVPGAWPVSVSVPDVADPEVKHALDDLVKLFVTKGGYTKDGKHTPVALSAVDDFVQDLNTNDKLMFLGEKTISRLGCFGCHSIPGFENAKPIGTPLNGWGSKSPTKLDYGHIAEYLDDQPQDDAKDRDGTDPYYQEQLAEHTRAGFLYQKLHRPRSYDYKKTNEDLKSWDDRLRMPQFAFANDPQAVEEVMTFVLGLTGEKINARYLPKTHYSASQTAVARGDKLLNRYNCTGCHVLEMPKYTLAPGVKFDDAFLQFDTKVKVANSGRAGDFLKEFAPGLTYDPKQEPKIGPPDDQPIEVEGMPIDLFEDELTVQVWRQVEIRGFTFQVGDLLTFDQTKIKQTEPVGGNFAWLYATTRKEQNGDDFKDAWNRLPPPLLREGLKVQTPWLMGFLKDPYPIRPATNLRMPKFHFGSIPTNDAARETTELANSFAARDKAEFPYPQIPERTREYLAEAESKHKGYLNGGWQMMSKGACVQCHALGQYQPTGGEKVVNGPDLRQVADRFRPAYLAEWLANPKRMLPYTAMPQNIPPEGWARPPAVPDSFEGKPLDMVKAVRDTLLNYTNAVEQQLAGAVKPEEKPAPKAEGGSD